MIKCLNGQKYIIGFKKVFKGFTFKKNMKADLHNHLRTSSNLQEIDFNIAISLAMKRLGINSVFGLVNFADGRYEEFIGFRGYDRIYLGNTKNAIYIPEKGVLVVKGQEVPTKQGHILILGLGYDIHLKQFRDLEDTLKEAKDNDGTVIVDHPFHLNGLGSYLEANPQFLEEIDAIEVYNGEACFGIPKTSFPYRANRRAQEFYDKIKRDFVHLGALASSDGHSMYELGRNWTEIDNIDMNKLNFLYSLRNSVRNTNKSTKMKKYPLFGIFGSMDHIVDLAFITKIAPKIGLENLFKIEGLK